MRDLPPGLTHPYEATVAKCESFRHGFTFTWTRGDGYLAVQRGRVANASRVTVYEDPHPGDAVLTGRQPVIDWMPAPPSDRWSEPGILAALADQWAATQRGHRVAADHARMRRSA
ncbi:MAG: hypothetical protein ACRDQW_12490 [Haloechinothrix sp.]